MTKCDGKIYSGTESMDEAYKENHYTNAKL